MRRLLIYILIAISLQTMAQSYQQRWISHPAKDSTMGVWFRQTYIGNRLPKFAKITITTTGHFALYVNSSNVTTDIRNAIGTNDHPAGMTYDVSRYLRPDSNTIAVSYLPNEICDQSRQISLTYYGKDADDKEFCYEADESWLCRFSDRLLGENGEIFDNRKYETIWHETTEFSPGLWQHPAVDYQQAYSRPEYSFYPTLKVDKTIRPLYWDENADTIFYEFGRGFYGYLRVTIRDAKKGEHINIAGLDYICNGTTDEQAYRLFSEQFVRRPFITGDRMFRKSQIQKVEGITIVPTFHSSWRY